MNSVYIYFWLAMFLIVNPLYTFFLVRGRKASLIGKMYIFATATMFSLFFFGLSSGIYILSAIAVFFFILSTIMTRGKSWRSN